MDSVRDGQAVIPDDHQHPRELSEGDPPVLPEDARSEEGQDELGAAEEGRARVARGEMPVPPEDDTPGEEGGGQDELGAAEQRNARVARGSHWQRYYRKKRKAKLARDTQRYYTTFYSQFTNIVMVSAFMGGLEAAILSFLHDVLSDSPLGKQLFQQEEYWVELIYSSYSMGLMLGLLSVSLSFTAAIVAAVNAAFACHLSLQTASRTIPMERRVLLCIFFQFWGLVCAVISLCLLCKSLSLTLTALIAALLLSGVFLPFSHVRPTSPLQKFEGAMRNGGPPTVLFFAFSIFIVFIDIFCPSGSSWVTIAVVGFTSARLVWTLHPALLEKSKPPRLWTVVRGPAAAWACLTFLRGLEIPDLKEKEDADLDIGLSYTVIVLGALQCLMLLGFGIADFIMARRRSKGAQSDAQREVAP